MKPYRILIATAWCIVVGAVLTLFISLLPGKTGHATKLKTPTTNVETQQGSAPASLP
ncbi:MAG: hypothetical protein H6577_05435 [Lewinellaceae bacterium]|nr:hypothetical protein [Saprospiraceae bacterium]MCB9337547.1 hypothetical protein [Lewinellaceae bacterium]